jgi:hypothetical protein
MEELKTKTKTNNANSRGREGISVASFSSSKPTSSRMIVENDRYVSSLLRKMATQEESLRLAER